MKNFIACKEATLVEKQLELQGWKLIGTLIEDAQLKEEELLAVKAALGFGGRASFALTEQ